MKVSACGSFLAVTLVGATVFGLPFPSLAQHGARCGTRSTAPCEVPDSLRFETVSAGYAHTCGITRDGAAWCWGDGRKGALGDGSARVQRWPQKVATDVRFVEIAAGGDFTCGRTADSTAWCWGTGRAVPGWPNPTPHLVKKVATAGVARLTAGRRHACVLDAEGRAACWGWNVDGETGTGTSGIESSMVASPTAVAGDHRFASISAGFNFTCGVTMDAALLCWGSNVDGLLGAEPTGRCGDVGAVPCSSHPVVVPTTESMRHVSSGTSHACAVGAVSGTVFCWGANGSGQLGDLGPSSSAPRAVSIEGVRFESVSSGGIESCAVAVTRQVYCWGADYRGTRATGLAPEEVRSRRVGGNWRSVSMGQVHGCAVAANRKTLCWGDTILGALGIR